MLSEAEKADLGLPRSGTFEMVVVPGERIGMMYRGFSLEMVGRLFRERLNEAGWPDGPVSPRGWPADPPYIEIFGTRFLFPRLELYVMTVRIKQSAAALTWRWDPVGGERAPDLSGEPESKKLREKFRLARRFIDDASHRGPPLGNTDLTDDQFRERLAICIEDYLESHKPKPKPPTRKVIAPCTGYGDVKDFDDRLARVNVKWKDAKGLHWLAEWRAVHERPAETRPPSTFGFGGTMKRCNRQRVPEGSKKPPIPRISRS